jgi:TolB-like protein/Tfp pilus assembly protein PilF
MPGETSDLRDYPAESSPVNRLNSWKEIATYLKHSERTVRRWQHEGLPVHRHAHKKRPGVYAYKSELDAWWNKGHARLEEMVRTGDGRKGHWLVWLTAAGLTVVLSAAGAYLGRNRVWPRARPPAGKIMLAVLPFENLSGDPGQEYFSDGLTEEMISRLSQLEPHRLGIIARTSAVQYKGTKKRIDQIGQELAVHYILEGTVRRAGDRVRVSAQLVQVSDQTHLWARSYESTLRDILTVQEEIAQAIANEVEIKLTPESQARTPSAAPVNAAAHEAYLKGRYYLTKTTGRDLNQALDYFEQAVKFDPKYALGYAGLAETYNAMNTGYLAPREAEPKAKAAAAKALELDETLALAHASLGRVHLLFDWDWPGAQKEFLRSLELNPNLPEAHLGYAEYLTSLGQFQNAAEHIHAAFMLDPLSISARFWGIDRLYTNRRYQQTLSECRKVKELPPDFTEPFDNEAFLYVRLGRPSAAMEAAAEALQHSDNPMTVAKAAQVYAELGDKEKARSLLRQLLLGAQKQYVCGYNLAAVYAALGQTDSAFHWLDEGIRQRSL